MRAALDGRSDASFLVLARTSAFSVGSVDQAVLRVTAYEEEGVDAIFLSGIKTLDHLNAARDALSLPIVVGAVGPELQDQDVLRRAGVSLWAQGNQPHFAALHAMRASYEAVLRGEAPGAITAATTDLFVDELLEGPLYKRRTNVFLS